MEIGKCENVVLKFKGVKCYLGEKRAVHDSSTTATQAYVSDSHPLNKIFLPFRSLLMATQGEVITCKGNPFHSLFLSFYARNLIFDVIVIWDLWSRGGLGTQQAIGDRGCAGGSAAGWWSPNQDTLHCSLPHWCLHLEWQGSYFFKWFMLKFVLFYVWCWNVSELVVWLAMLFCNLNGLSGVMGNLFTWVCYF